MTQDFFHCGYFANGVLNLTPAEAYTLCENEAIIVDVREEYMAGFKMFMVPAVIFMPFSSLKSGFHDLPADKPLIFADAVGIKSRDAVMFVREQGIENAANLCGGIVDWERDGLPVTTDKTRRLSGSCMCQLKPREVKSTH